MALFSKSNTTCTARSISLLDKSHPTPCRIEKELNDIKTWVSLYCSSFESVSDGLSRLSGLYACMEDLLDFSSMTQDLISSQRKAKWVEELLDALVRFLDVCEVARDIVSNLKEHVRELQCSLRRRKGDSCTESSVTKYKCFRKRIKNDIKRLTASLKHSGLANSDDGRDNDNHEEVIRTVTEVREVSVFIFISLLAFLVPEKRTLNRNQWSLVGSKLIQKRRVACEEHHQRNRVQKVEADFENFDVVLLNACIKSGTPSFATCRLEAMEVQIERIESGLDCMFRRLVRTRASLLNIISN